MSGEENEVNNELDNLSSSGSAPSSTSPPTSPMPVSPPTSPRHAPSSGNTSSSSDSSDSSDTVSGVGNWNKRKASKRTLRRKEKLQKIDGIQDNEGRAIVQSVVVDHNVETMQHDEARTDDQTQHRDESSIGPDSSSSSEIAYDSSDSDSDHGISADDSSAHSSDTSRDREESDSDNNSSVDSADNLESLFDGSDMSPNEALLLLMKLFIEERWTKKSLDKNIKLIKKLLPQPSNLPSSGKAAQKKLELLTSPCKETEFSYCNECLQLSGECNHNAGSGKFYSFPIADQVKHMFEQRGLASAIEHHRNHCKTKIGCICDITDGTEFKKVKEHLLNMFDLVLLWNTDGLALSGSSKQEIWLILCTICELPPRLRSSFMIVAGAFVGTKKPDMNVFLKPFCESLKGLWENGVSWVHPVSKTTFQSKIAASVLSADAPAKALVLKTLNYNSKYGCNSCEQKTKKIPLTAEELQFNATIPDKRKKKRRKRRFLFEEDLDPATLRSGDRMAMMTDIAERSREPCRGVIGESVVSEIPHLDRGHCVSAEYLHTVLLGVVKYFLTLIFFTNTGAWFIGHKMQEIDEFIGGIQVPDYIKRLPRKIKDLKFWKASELRAFLLYYSLPAFKGRLPEEYFQHWLLLVSAIYIFLKEEISESDFAVGEIMIRCFVRDIGKLYGDVCYVYNAHTLSHLPLLVRRWGPLWATSAFVFESFNGYISDRIHGTKHFGKELMENIKIWQSVAILDNIVNSPSLDHLRFPSKYGSRVLGKGLNVNQFKKNQIEALQRANLGNYTLYARASHNGKIFTNAYYDEDKKRSDSYIQFQRGTFKEYAKILAIVTAADNTSLHCLVKMFAINQVELFLHTESRYIVRHLIPVRSVDDLCVIPIECILMKVLKIGEYIAICPNSYEVNL